MAPWSDPVGWNNLGWNNPPVAAAGGPVLSYIDNSAGNADYLPINTAGASATSGTVSFGTNLYSGNRRLIALFMQGDSYDGPVTGISFTPAGGSAIAATISTHTGTGGAAGSYSGMVTWGWADVPTGTTGTVTINQPTLAGGNGNGLLLIYAFDKTTIVNPTPTIAFFNPSGVTSSAMTVDAGANGFIIAQNATCYLGTGATMHTSSSTETYTVNRTLSNGAIAEGTIMACSVNSGTTANTSSGITFVWTNSDQSLGSMLAWN